MNSQPVPLGSGQAAPPSTYTDAPFMSAIRAWRRAGAAHWRSVVPADLGRWLPTGTSYASPKVDGELWFLVLEPQQAPLLVSSDGRGLSGLPLLAEAAKLSVESRVILAGELYVATSQGRPKAQALAEVLEGGAAAATGKLGFVAFDWIADAAPIHWPQRHAKVQQLLAGGRRLSVTPAERCTTVEEVMALFATWVEGGKAEGVVLRTEDGRIFKLKPELHLDCVVTGYTLHAQDPSQVAAIAIALLRPDGRFQLIGSVDGLGNEQTRRRLLAELKGRECPSRLAYATHQGTVFQWIRPERVVELRVTDVDSDDPDGTRIIDPVLSYDLFDGWVSLRTLSSVRLRDAVFERFREDKGVNPVDLRLSQLSERAHLPDSELPLEANSLPSSTLMRREVYVRQARGVTAVRKLLVWRTNKDKIDPAFPAWVIHWTDYSPSRAEPLVRIVRPAPDAITAERIATELIEEHLKKGWERVP